MNKHLRTIIIKVTVYNDFRTYGKYNIYNEYLVQNHLRTHLLMQMFVKKDPEDTNFDNVIQIVYAADYWKR